MVEHKYTFMKEGIPILNRLLLFIIACLYFFVVVRIFKVKVIPLQARCGPEGG